MQSVTALSSLMPVFDCKQIHTRFVVEDVAL